MMADSIRKLIVIIVIAICLSAAIVSTTFSGNISRMISGGYHGYSSHVHLNLTAPGIVRTTPVLILPVFINCQHACPANLQLVRQIVRQYKHSLRLVVLPVQAEKDTTPDLQRYAEFTGLIPEILNPDASAAWQFLTVREQIRQSLPDHPAHAGNLYLYYPAQSELLTYIDPDVDAVIDDLLTLTQGTSNGATVPSAPSK